MKKLNRKSTFIHYLGGALCLFLLIQGTLGGQIIENRIPQQTHSIRDGWKVELEDHRIIYPDSLPQKIDNETGKTIVMERTLPTEKLDMPYIMVGSTYEYIAAYLDGEKIYEFKEVKKENAHGTTRLLQRYIPLPQDYEGKKLTLEFNSSYALYSRVLPAVDFGSYSVLILQCLVRELPGILAGIILAILGVILLIFNITFIIKGSKIPKGSWALNFISFSTGCWLLSEFHSLRFIHLNFTVLYYINYFSFYTIFISFIQFLIDDYQGRYKKILKICKSILVAYFFCGLIGEVTKQFGFFDMQIFTGFLILLEFLLILILLLKDTGRPGALGGAIMTGYLLIAIILDGFIFYKETYSFQNEFMITFFVFLILIGYIIGKGGRCFYTVVQEEEKNIMLQEQLQHQVNYYQRDEKIKNKLQLFRHDMKNNLNTIEHLLIGKKYEEAKKYIASLSQAMVPKHEIIVTGNPVFDAIITEKQLQAEKIGICFVKEIVVPAKMSIDAITWISILGNALDNAIEACTGNSQQRVEIYLQVKYCKGILRLVIINTFLQTNKQAKIKRSEDHGYGIISMRRAAKRYDGSVEMESDDKFWKTYITLYGIINE